MMDHDSMNGGSGSGSGGGTTSSINRVGASGGPANDAMAVEPVSSSAPALGPASSGAANPLNDFENSGRVIIVDIAVLEPEKIGDGMQSYVSNSDPSEEFKVA
jgi:hypothetical protein